MINNRKNHTLSSLKKSGSTSIISEQAFKMENFATTSIKHVKWHKEQRPTREGAKFAPLLKRVFCASHTRNKK